MDKPAVLHSRQTIVGRPPPIELQKGLDQLPRVSTDYVITALRLGLNTPISVILQEHELEGMMAFGGRGTSWGDSSPTLRPVVTLD